MTDLERRIEVLERQIGALADSCTAEPACRISHTKVIKDAARRWRKSATFAAPYRTHQTCRVSCLRLNKIKRFC